MVSCASRVEPSRNSTAVTVPSASPAVALTVKVGFQANDRAVCRRGDGDVGALFGGATVIVKPRSCRGSEIVGRARRQRVIPARHTTPGEVVRRSRILAELRRTVEELDLRHAPSPSEATAATLTVAGAANVAPFVGEVRVDGRRAVRRDRDRRSRARRRGAEVVGRARRQRVAPARHTAPGEVVGRSRVLAELRRTVEELDLRHDTVASDADAARFTVAGAVKVAPSSAR